MVLDDFRRNLDAVRRRAVHDYVLGPDSGHGDFGFERPEGAAGQLDTFAADHGVPGGCALHVQREHVPVSHEASHVSVCRQGIHLVRRADLLDDAVAKHDQPIGHGEGLFLVVGHVDRGQVQRLVDVLDLDAHGLPQLGVQVRERLIHEHERRFIDDRSGDGYALLLAARELGGQLLGLVLETDQPQDLVDPRLDFGAGSAPHLETEGDVFAHGHVREKGVVLEDHPEATLLGWESVDLLVVEVDAAVGQR